MFKIQLRKRAFRFLSEYGDYMSAKFSNICKKTGPYSVPLELFQKRTSRSNRSLISWDAVLRNNLTFEQLNTFEGGIVVEFINNDYFESVSNPLFEILKKDWGATRMSLQ